MNKKTIKSLSNCTMAAVALTIGISTGNVQAQNSNVQRFAGNDRYETAANVAKLNWESGKTDNVILVSGGGYADALSASLLAQKLNAPILLTEKDVLNKNTYDAMNKLGAKNVYILGSEGVVSNNIKASLEKSGKKVIRLAGKDRYETNIAIANELVSKHGVTANEVLVVNGNRYLADALTAAPVAAKEGKILLLVGEDESTSNEAKKFIDKHNSKVTVIGRDVTVSDTIYNKLRASKRINGGADRFETNRLVLDAFKLKGSHVYIANGEKNHLVDSLVASALAGKYKSPIVLVSNGKESDSKAVSYIKNNLKINDKVNLNVIGSEKILSKDLVQKINEVIEIKELPNKPEDNLKNISLDIVREDGRTTVDEDYETPGVQISLNNNESIKFKILEKADKTTVVKDITVQSIDLGKNSVVNKDVSGETITLTAVKEGKSTVTIGQGQQNIKLDVTVKRPYLPPVKENNHNVVPELNPVEVPPVVEPEPEVVPELRGESEVVKKPELKPASEVVEKAESKRELVVNNHKVELESSIERHGQRGSMGTEQKSHVKIIIPENDGLIKNEHDITIAGKQVKVKSGDNATAIKHKIIEIFKDNKDWDVENIYIVEQGNKPSTVSFTSKHYENNINDLAQNTDEVKFEQRDESYGRKPIYEIKEICNINVIGVSNKQETIKVNVSAEKNHVLNQTVNIDVKPTDTTKDVARSIYNAFKKNGTLIHVYNMTLDERNSRIILTQKMGELLDTKVTIK
ncbi:cell wall-binding repeat-containing protein [Clostridium niameyense]|uniref:Cell wall-binding repeat-containing protein n=1 Tax=Clostridium niameyense TaxID=1622073 RepID=A0A6M0RBL6_9CLOT|nr:cell wall-binding repeat-containing protein [Clostridium niameyense]NEZ47187.1 cell wall-binding repeat-containing protein [Clostridium niameyense]